MVKRLAGQKMDWSKNGLVKKWIGQKIGVTEESLLQAGSLF
ncbi:hypothetical protein [Stieleria sp.]